MKKFLVTLTLLLVLPALVWASTPTNLVPTADSEYQLNYWMGPVALQKLLGSLIRGAHRVAKCTWDFAVQGGAVGNISTGQQLPANSIIREVWYDVTTAPTSATSTATIALKSKAAGDLKAAASVASQYTAGLHLGIPIRTTATAVKLDSVATNIYLTVASEALTAGKINVYLDYLLSDYN